MRARLLLTCLTTLAVLALPTTALAGQSHRPVCPGPGARGAALCDAHVVTDSHGSPNANPAPAGYGPAQFRAAYGLPSAASTAQTIAIVDAYDDPNVASNL